MTDWPEETCLQLIDLYRENESLWETTHKDYTKKNRREDCWRKIAAEMGKTPDQCKFKINNLKASWRRERRKVAKATKRRGTNESYVSRWFAFEALEFLNDIAKPRITMDSENWAMVAATHEDTDDENVDDPVSIQDDNSMSQNSFIAPNVRIRPSSSKKMEVDEHSAMMTDAYDMLKTAAEILKTSSAPADETESFLNFVSAKVKNYSPQTQKGVQYAIFKILMKADSGYYEWSDIHNQYGFQPNIAVHSQLSTSQPANRPLDQGTPRMPPSPSPSSASSPSTTPSPSPSS